MAAGSVVVCDRYKYSSVCYQHLHGVPLDLLLKLNQFRAPDVAVLLSLDSGEILERMTNRGGARDVFESEEFVRQASLMFHRMPDLFPDESFVRLSAELNTDELSEMVLREVLR